MKLKKGTRHFAKRLLAAALILLLSALLVPACDNHTPDPITGLIVSFLPNPVPHDVTESTSGSWTYIVSVTEARGVGVNITGFTVQRFSAANVPYSESDYDSVTFETWFRSCGGSSNYVAARETRCGLIRSIEGRNSGHADWTFEGIDDNGTLVTGEARVDFL